ncbi:MAG: hypothetical protein KGZ81_07245 [Flavobacteriales bacterium]|nr:hypothetical protein [Flavobacteriales bacterium]
MTTTKYSIKPGRILTAWDGMVYNRLGHTHLVLAVSKEPHTLASEGSTLWYHVTTAVINANGKPGLRGVDFWVSTDGSVHPISTHLNLLDGGNRSNFYRLRKEYLESKISQHGTGE